MTGYTLSLAAIGFGAALLVERNDRWSDVGRALIPASVLGLAWDRTAVAKGWWSYGAGGRELFGLPAVEYLFYPVAVLVVVGLAGRRS